MLYDRFGQGIREGPGIRSLVASHVLRRIAGVELPTREGHGASEGHRVEQEPGDNECTMLSGSRAVQDCELPPLAYVQVSYTPFQR